VAVPQARLPGAFTVLALAAAILGCSGPKPPTVPSGPVVSTTTITITSAGVSPKDIQIALGARVLFINNDTKPHEMGSDPHPDHTECPFINQVGFLQPGERRETGNSVLERVCGFHDHDNPDVQNLRGTITTK
jgi:hypothetical protein